ncbi:MAG: hypothetical protein KAR06_06665, partial [Deltaproteobacteria bacterium]|nr:hypothetical protein [Deltaproteobacteria bacterium]
MKLTMINKILLITFIMFLPFALLSCGGDTTSVTDTVANANAKKRSKKKEVKKEVAKEVFGPGNERNIFVSYLAMEEEAIDETPRGPLEHFDLGVLHLKAVLRAGDSVTALIASPDGKTHRANA